MAEHETNFLHACNKDKEARRCIALIGCTFNATTSEWPEELEICIN